jgi:hypothetical protein
MDLIKKILFLVGIVMSQTAICDQSADPNFKPKNIVKTFTKGLAPLVAFDEGHNNYHSIKDKFGSFSKVLKSDGFKVISTHVPFSMRSLDGVDVLVVANALNKKNINNWDLPNYSAFNRQEIIAVYQWVKKGGALLLLADHMPWPAASAELAGIFGFGFNNGYVEVIGESKQFFNVEENSLLPHPILQLGKKNQIDEVRAFFGQGFLIPPDAKPILKFVKPSISWMPSKSWDITDSTPQIDATGWLQGASLEFGKGRVVVFGEAAMFSAQVVKEDNGEEWMMGMNAPDAKQNEQFLLNTMHWLVKKI